MTDTLRKEMNDQVSKFTYCLVGVKTDLAAVKNDIAWVKRFLWLLLGSTVLFNGLSFF